jgi:hypothetical protein
MLGITFLTLLKVVKKTRQEPGYLTLYTAVLETVVSHLLCDLNCQNRSFVILRLIHSAVTNVGA